MNPIFAQIENVPSEFLKNFVLVVAGLFAIAYYAKEIFFSGGRKKREVSFEFVPASKAEFEKQKDHCTKRHGELFVAIESVEQGTAAVVEQKVDGLRKDMNEVSKEVAAIKAGMKYQDQQLASMDVKITKLLERK
ncbi:MAG TPA: hypothetical protein VGO57_02230 [Verrucomicrobiae bacterium]|jgi:hypothetical protein